MESLKGKSAIVTGAASGIGAGVARQLAKHGTNVTLVDKNETYLLEIGESCRKLGVQVLTLVVDLTDDKQLAVIIDRTVELFGGLNILVNNAGTTHLDDFVNFPADKYDLIFQVNTRAMFLLTQLAVPHLEKAKGSVVNISSTLTSKVFTGTIAYQMSKGAVDIFTKAAALELAERGIRVNAIQPGVVNTNILKNSGVSSEDNEKYMNDSLEYYPCKRFGTPEEIANGVCFLASEAASFVTGELIRVDGGYGAGTFAH